MLTLDIFKQMLADVGNAKTKQNLLIYARLLVDMTNETAAQRWLENKQSVLGQAFADGIAFAKCTLFLCADPATLPQNISLQDVDGFADYRGPNGFRKSIRGLLKNCKVLGDIYQDALRTAGAAESGQAALGKLLAGLKSAGRELAPDCCKCVADVLAEVASLKKKVRKGAADVLVTEACAFVREMTVKARW